MPPGYGKQVPFKVDCPNPSRFGISITDNNAATLGVPGNGEFGLGNYTEAGVATPIGSYYVYRQDIKIQTTVGGPLVNPTIQLQSATLPVSPTSWVPAAFAAPAAVAVGAFAYSDLPGDTQPGALASLSGTLNVILRPLQAVVNNAKNVIPLEGSLTLTLVGM